MLAISKFKLYFWKLVYLIRLAFFFCFTNIINGALVFLSHTFLCQIPIHSSKQRKHELFSKPGLPYDQTRWQSLKKIDYFLFLQQAKRPSWFCSFISFSPANQFTFKVSLVWIYHPRYSQKIFYVGFCWMDCKCLKHKFFKALTNYSLKKCSWKEKIAFQTTKFKHKSRKKNGNKKPQKQYCLNHKRTILQTDLRSCFIYKHIPYSTQLFNFK